MMSIELSFTSRSDLSETIRRVLSLHAQSGMGRIAAGSDSSLPAQSLHDSEEQTTNDQKRSNCIEQIYANTTGCW